MRTRDEVRLAARCDELLRRSTELRSWITADATAISEHLRVVDRASAFLRSGGGRALIWGALLLILATGPGRAFKVAGRTAVLWSVARRLLPHALALRRGARRA